jgi:L-ascorbate metabolism protein UlaG (beta-lactamase superfamily)
MTLLPTASIAVTGRRLSAVLAVAVLTMAAGCGSAHRGPVTDHFDGSRFFNPGHPKDSSVAGYLWLRLTGSQAIWPEAVPQPPAPPPPARVSDGSALVTYVGHATVLIQVEGLNVVVDPLWSERASPFSWAGPKRVTPPGVAFDALPRIDVVLISHDHFDHLDLATLARLDARDRPRVVVPLGNRTLVASAMPASRVSEHDWGERLALSDRVRLHLEPMRHGSGRTPWSQQSTLWAAYLIETDALRLYHAGDTGYSAAMFRSTAERHGDVDLAILPIGAYEPESFMADSHMTPALAVQVAQDLRARQAMAHHFETFALGFEAHEAPRRALSEALRTRGWTADRFVAPRAGESLRVSPMPRPRVAVR